MTRSTMAFDKRTPFNAMTDRQQQTIKTKEMRTQSQRQLWSEKKRPAMPFEAGRGKRVQFTCDTDHNVVMVNSNSKLIRIKNYSKYHGAVRGAKVMAKTQRNPSTNKQTTKALTRHDLDGLRRYFFGVLHGRLHHIHTKLRTRIRTRTRIRKQINN